MSKVQQLRERIQCGTYTVDSDAVAAAILKRLLGDEEEAPVSHWRNYVQVALPGLSAWRGASPR